MMIYHFVSWLVFASYVAQASDPVFEISSESKSIEMKLNQGEISSRYQVITDSNGKVAASNLQDRVLLNLKICFFENRVRVEMLGTSGNTFAVSWSQTGVGSHDRDFEFNLRRLFLSATLGQGVDVTLGSFGPEAGAGTEATALDADGYIVGYRAKVEVLNGSVVVTTGYLGDFKEPNVFKRLGRMDEFNYLQAVLNYQLLENVKSSIEYTHYGENDYVRPALNIKVKQWASFLDSLLVETLVPFQQGGAVAISVGVARQLNGKVSSILPNGASLLLSSSYEYTKNIGKMPFGDHVIEGSSVRIQVKTLNLMSFSGGTIDMFLDFLQSLDSIQRRRFELGVSLKL